MDKDQILEMAKGFKNSNIPHVALLAEAYVQMAEDYNELLAKYTSVMGEFNFGKQFDILKQQNEELRDKLIKTAGELIMIQHRKTFQKLADSGD